MDIAAIKSKLASLKGDARKGAIDAINNILSARNQSASNGSAGRPDSLDIDPNLIVPTSKSQAKKVNKDEYDDPDDILSKRKFHNRDNNNSDENNENESDDSQSSAKQGTQSGASKSSTSSSTDKSENEKQSSNGKSTDKQNNGQHSPQIGDMGDPNSDIQKAEAAYRQANEYHDAAEEKAEEADEDEAEEDDNDTDAQDDNDTDAQDDYTSEADKVKNLAKKAKTLLDKAQGEGLDQKEKARLERIQNALNDSNIRDEIMRETDNAVFKSDQLRHDKEQEKNVSHKLNYGGITEFKRSIDRFMKNATKREKELTWRKPNKKYGPESGLIAKGRAYVENKNIPLLAVYFDQSGSWGPDDVKIGQDAIASLNAYVKRGLLKIKVYYFSDNVSGNAKEVEGGSTTATQKILDHIKAIHADNVVIMTDSDMDYQGEFTSTLKVKGGVWFLFRNGSVCNKLMNHLKGRMLNQAFNI